MGRRKKMKMQISWEPQQLQALTAGNPQISQHNHEPGCLQLEKHPQQPQAALSTRTPPRRPLRRVKRLSLQLEGAWKRPKVLQAKSNRLTQKNLTLMDIIDDLKAKNLPSEEAERKLGPFGNFPKDLLNSWCTNAEQQPHERRYSLEMRKFASTLHYYSPRAYEYLRTLFSMPSVRSIRQWLKVVDSWPCFTREVLDGLKEKHKDDTPREQLCSIIPDGMSIKKVCELDSSSGRLIGYVDLGHSQDPQNTDECLRTPLRHSFSWW
ncbi:hypothetical protein HPB48_022418 [Haemaphysalis longicornis]|uniref:Transposase n=1 Tax=Haemaphysalis longicornis TaxID=44386 RepID=A0A9J6GB66_HAELO|nr:hypothetical protein HPB48_022418 [Haemaphysalis longicornis]